MYICIYVCMYICMYVYMISIYLEKEVMSDKESYTSFGRISMLSVYMCMYVCMYIYMYVCMYVCMYICVCIYDSRIFGKN